MGLVVFTIIEEEKIKEKKCKPVTIPYPILLKPYTNLIKTIEEHSESVSCVPYPMPCTLTKWPLGPLNSTHVILKGIGNLMTAHIFWLRPET